MLKMLQLFIYILGVYYIHSNFCQPINWVNQSINWVNILINLQVNNKKYKQFAYELLLKFILIKTYIYYHYP